MVLVDPAVAAVAVVAAPDPELGQVPVAFLVLHGVDGASRSARARGGARARSASGSMTALVKSKRPISLNVVERTAGRGDGQGAAARACAKAHVAVIAHLDCR